MGSHVIERELSNREKFQAGTSHIFGREFIPDDFMLEFASEFLQRDVPVEVDFIDGLWLRRGALRVAVFVIREGCFCFC